MAQHYQNPTQPTPLQSNLEREVVARADVASPAPLGLNVLAFVTAILGCYYTGFIVPYESALPLKFGVSHVHKFSLTA